MPDRQTVLAAPPSCSPPALAGAFRVSEPGVFYRARHPERLVFYQLFERHFDEYLYAYEERFEPGAGVLRSVVPKAVEAFLSCGRPEAGFVVTYSVSPSTQRAGTGQGDSSPASTLGRVARCVPRRKNRADRVAA
jgi:hypothetical protein